jgi:hypothetical protein
LNPLVLMKNLRILAAKRAKAAKNGQEVDPGGPHLAGGDEAELSTALPGRRRHRILNPQT